MIRVKDESNDNLATQIVCAHGNLISKLNDVTGISSNLLNIDTNIDTKLRESLTELKFIIQDILLKL